MTDRVHQREAEAENYDLGHTVGHARIVSPGIAPEAQQVPLSISKVVAGPSKSRLCGVESESESFLRDPSMTGTWSVLRSVAPMPWYRATGATRRRGRTLPTSGSAV